MPIQSWGHTPVLYEETPSCFAPNPGLLWMGPERKKHQKYKSYHKANEIRLYGSRQPIFKKQWGNLVNFHLSSLNFQHSCECSFWQWNSGNWLYLFKFDWKLAATAAILGKTLPLAPWFHILPIKNITLTSTSVFSTAFELRGVDLRKKICAQKLGLIWVFWFKMF
jgi:hypothetical protein